MRRLVAFVAVAAVAFLSGAAVSNGTLTRLLAEAHLSNVPTATVVPVPTATQAGVVPVVAVTVPPLKLVTPPARVPTVVRPTATATPTAIPTSPAAVALGQKTTSGATLSAGGWVGAGGPSLVIMAPAVTGDLRAELEVRPRGEPFSGASTRAAAVSRGVALVTLPDLASGPYHWQARLTSSGGAGKWTAFDAGATAFRVQREAPPAPAVFSPTNPNPDRTYGTATVAFNWTHPSDSSGIVGYSFRLDTNPQGAAHAIVRTQAQQASLGGLSTGTYYFHVRAVDGVGNWGPSSTFPVRIDLTAPQVANVSFSRFRFNPALEPLRMDYTLTKVSRVTVGIYNSAGIRVRHIVLAILMPAKVPLSVTWDGRDNAGRLVTPGLYSVYLRATDRLGNSNVFGWNDFYVSSRRIVVSLTKQQLWAYDGNRLLLTTLVTTGNQALPTPTGLFHIVFGRSPFTFHSPWPKGSKFWYEDSKVNYALYFHDFGFYIHDAPWRVTFGPGSNAGVGTPGSNYTGTHGCINVPEDAMKQLYTWATPGTDVEIDA